MYDNSDQPTYNATTREITVQVEPSYLSQSSPDYPGQHLFTYDVTITNKGQEPVQLLRRHWIITDGHGMVQEVRGAGVVGKRPTILPGRSHQYSSYCPLPTEIGTMRGTYQMVTTGGEFFDVEIPAFPLVAPGARN